MQNARPRPEAPRSVVTVADALRLALPAGTRVAHGHQHLRRHVSWVRLFVTRPYQLTAIEPDALVILSLRGLTAGPQLQRLPRLLEALVAAQVSSVVLSDDSPEFCEAAAEADALAVLVLPQDSSLAEIERATIALIVDRSSQMQRRLTEVYEDLVHLALLDSPLQQLADALSEAAERVIYLEDEFGALQALAVPADHEAQGLPDAEEAAALYSARELFSVSPSMPAGLLTTGAAIRRVLADGRHAVCSAPIVLGQTIAGFLTILGDADETQDLDEHLAVRSASAFAIPIAKQRAIIETQTRLQGSFLESLFSGSLHNWNEISERARYLGHDLMQPYTTACFAVDERAEQRNGQAEGLRAALWASFLESARREILSEWPRALVKDRGELLAVLFPSEPGDDGLTARNGLERVRGRLSQMLVETTATCGLGPSASGPEDIVRSYLKAEQAARIGRYFLGGDHTVAFDELGAYRLLANVADRQALDAFYQEYLGAIEVYDTRYNGELIETLEGFFAANGNHARAAETLHLHRNTLLYRLSRIEALSGHDLGDPEIRLCLHLALKIRHLGQHGASTPRTLAPAERKNT